jgi:hypothetical protein
MYPVGYAEKIYFALTGGSVENEREKEMEKVIEQIKDLVATL